MFNLNIYEDFSLRAYGDKIAILGRRDGGRVGINGKPAQAICALVEKTDFGELVKFAHQGIPANNALRPVYDVVREPFDRLKKRVGPTAEKDMNLRGFVGYSFRNRIPVNCLFEITYRCNLRCTHCYVLHLVSEPKPQHMPFDLVERVLEELAHIGTVNLTLSGGESLLHPQWPQIIRKAKDMHMHVAFKTNGLMMNRRRAEIYAEDPAHSLHYSLYGATAAIHDDIAALPGAFDRTIESLELLSELGIKVTVIILITKHNVHQLEAMIELCEKMGHKPSHTDLISGRLNGDRSPRDLKISEETRQDLVARGFLKPFKPAACTAGAFKIKIAPNGEVFTCEFVPTPFGNLAENSLKEIFYGEDFAEFGKNIVDMSKVRPPGSKRKINSCPGLNLLNTGEYIGVTEV